MRDVAYGFCDGNSTICRSFAPASIVSSLSRTQHKPVVQSQPPTANASLCQCLILAVVAWPMRQQEGSGLHGCGAFNLPNARYCQSKLPNASCFQAFCCIVTPSFAGSICAGQTGRDCTVICRITGAAIAGLRLFRAADMLL
jgi:hypothetical protein